MRYAAYFVAVLVAVGLIYFVSQTDNADPAAGGPATSAEATPAEGVEAGAEGQLVSLKVPEMHCPFACYPAVKKTLEAEPGVLAVDLAEQQEEGAIDNPVVKVKVSKDFDAQAAVDALATAGFSDSTPL